LLLLQIELPYFFKLLVEKLHAGFCDDKEEFFGVAEVQDLGFEAE
jgi:hypothetical protein